MAGEQRKAISYGLLATSLLAGLIVLGSRNLVDFDAALTCYTFATLFAAFGVTYRCILWLHRPPTALYWRRGAQLLFRRGQRLRSLARLGRRFAADFLLNRFIFRRGFLRGAAHGALMWGCGSAVLITFPLVFGWIHFETLSDDLGHYQVLVFGAPLLTFPVDSLFGFLIFHALVWSSLLVIAGVLLALRRRLREPGAVALQQLGEDFLPLLLLFAISVTGLLLTVSYTWMKGASYEFLALLHAATVIFTLLWLPFGKLFHIFVRPMHLAVAAYKDAGQEGEQAACRRCGRAFAARMHVEDLITVQQELGYRYEIPDTKPEHYQWICPPCRRALLVLAQANETVGERRGVSPPVQTEPAGLRRAARPEVQAALRNRML